MLLQKNQRLKIQTPYSLCSLGENEINIIRENEIEDETYLKDSDVNLKHSLHIHNIVVSFVNVIEERKYTMHLTFNNACLLRRFYA